VIQVAELLFCCCGKIFGVFRVSLICSVKIITLQIKETLSSWKKAFQFVIEFQTVLF
jgi:hypothetical protein